MSGIIKISENQQRDLRIVTNEIINLQQQAQAMVLNYSIELGRRLTEAKSMVGHGEWGNYLKNELGYSQSTANGLMQVFREYGDSQITLFGAVANSQALGNLSYTKALRLIAIPADEREEFVQEHDVEHMSTRELEKAIRERDDAKRQLQDTSARLEQAEKDRATTEALDRELRQKYDQAIKDLQQADSEAQEADNARKVAEEKVAAAKAAEQKAKDKLKAMKENPSVPPEVLEKVKADAEAAAKAAADQELEAKTAELRAAAEQAQKDAAVAAENVEKIIKELEAAKKQAMLAAPEITSFRLHFEEFQREGAALMDCLRQVRTSDPETAEKLQNAFNKAIEQFRQAGGEADADGR